MKYISILTFFLSALLCSAQATKRSPLTTIQLEELLKHKGRPVEDRFRDSDRLPSKIMGFAQVAKGDRVLDLYAGGGWYSELFAWAVGQDGLVYAQNDVLTWRFGKSEMTQRTEANRLPNLLRIDNTDIANIKIPDNSIDIAFMAINFHDLYFTHRIKNGNIEVMRDHVVNYKTSFNTVRNALKKDGVLIIIDHFAKQGSGYEAANSLHRIDPNIVKYQLRDAGFTLLEEAFYLRNPKDDLSQLVFDPDVRGKTDRFIYKFGKSTTE